MSKISTSSLEAKIKRLERKWAKCRAWPQCKSSTAIYEYLAKVYEFYAELRADKVAQPAKKKIAKRCSLPTSSHALRTILDASCQEDAKMKSRSTQALRYAWRCRQKGDDIITFLQENGGPAGCANKWAETQRAQRGRRASP